MACLETPAVHSITLRSGEAREPTTTRPGMVNSRAADNLNQGDSPLTKRLA
jgi:hypothetical protein